MQAQSPDLHAIQQTSRVRRLVGRGVRNQVIPYLLVAPNLAWMLLFLMGAVGLLAVMSLRGYEAGGRGILDTWELTHYVAFLSDPSYLGIRGRSVWVAFVTTLCCIVLGFPLAYLLSQARGTFRAILYMCILLPLLTSTVVRTFGWMVLLSNNGMLNQTLTSWGLIEQPVQFMYSNLGIIIALTEVFLPFMVLALDAALLNIDKNLYDAARNLGAGTARIFFKITLPLTYPGVISGSILVFSLSVSAYVTPSLIGGARNPVMATLIYQQGVSLLNWPFGAAIAFILLATVMVLVGGILQLGLRGRV
jgi:putative spermidine/putrescine transport system permease protein